MGIKFLFSLNHHQSMIKEFYPQELWLRHFPLQFSIFHSRIEREVLDIYSFFTTKFRYVSDYQVTTRNSFTRTTLPTKTTSYRKTYLLPVYKNGIFLKKATTS